MHVEPGISLDLCICMYCMSRVEFRGSSSDEAALVTQSKTYAVRLVETSNTQLLVCANPNNMFLPIEANALYNDDPTTSSNAEGNPSPSKRQKLESGASVSTDHPDVFVPHRMIAGMVGHHYEVTEILPRLHVLRELLSHCLYLGDVEEAEAMEEERIRLEMERAADSMETEMDAGEIDEQKDTDNEPSTKRKRTSGPKRYTTSDLRRLIQASDAELFSGLDELDAFEDVRGHWRLLHPDLAAKVFDSILTLAEEKRWNRTNDLPADICTSELEELYEQRVTRHVLHMYSQKHKEGDDPNCKPSCT
jgi:hypothetical protein